MSRILSLLLILLFLPFSACAETGAERLSQLDIISQYDQRLTSERFYYMNMFFQIAGCKPSSVVNAMVALLGKPDTVVPELLVELRNGLMYNYSIKEASIELHRLPTYLQKPRATAVELIKLLLPVTQIVRLPQEILGMEPEAVLSPYLANENAHPLLLFELPMMSGMHWLVNATEALCKLGHPDARLAFCAAGTGTNDTDAPFRLGSSGHYVSLYFQAGEFHDNSTFYLLDSYPRGLQGEQYGYRLHYPRCYAFVDSHRGTFADIYDAVRVSDTVVQFNLRPDQLNALKNCDASSRTTLQLKQLLSVELLSTPYCIIYIP